MNNKESLQQSLQDQQSASIYNTLMKTQHQILLKELAKIDKLNRNITQTRKKRIDEHNHKMNYYQQTQQLLRQEVRKKDQIIKKLGVFNFTENVQDVQDGTQL